MTTMTTRLMTALLVGGCAFTALAQDAISPEQAARHVGKNGMVCGKVEKTRYAQNSEGQPTFLHMGGSFPRHTFSARVPQELRDGFRPSLEETRGPRHLRAGHDPARGQPRRDRGPLAERRQARHDQVIRPRG
jgi:hypothetical protein